MGLNRTAGQGITHAVKLYRRGIICPAVFWDAVAGHLKPEIAADVLDALPPAVGSEIRAIRLERTWSLRPESRDDTLRREIERWCTERDGSSCASGEL